MSNGGLSPYIYYMGWRERKRERERERERERDRQTETDRERERQRESSWVGRICIRLIEKIIIAKHSL